MEKLITNLNSKAIKLLIRYLISGGTTFIVDIVLLYTFTDILGFWYLWSSIFAFCIAIIVSFLLQKFWTFEDNTPNNTQKQFIIYVSVAICNTIINTFLIYIFVKYFGIFYLLSQTVAVGIIAIESFFIYRNFIFNQN